MRYVGCSHICAFRGRAGALSCSFLPPPHAGVVGGCACRFVDRLVSYGIPMTEQRLTPVILCGGAGTRLWPVSREKMPKHFVPLIGGLTTFQQVLDRVTRDPLFATPIIVTNADFRFV